MKRVSRRRDECITEMVLIISITSCANRANREHYNYEETYSLQTVTLHRVTVMGYRFCP